MWDRVYSIEQQAFYFIHDATMTVMWEYYDESKREEICREGQLYPRQHGWNRYWDPSRSRKLREQVGVSRWYFYHEDHGTRWSAAEEGSRTQPFMNPLTSLKTFGKQTVSRIKAASVSVRRKFESSRSKIAETQMTNLKKIRKNIAHKPKRPSTYDMWRRFFDAEHGIYCYENIRDGHIKWEDPETGRDVENAAPENGWRLYNDDTTAREYFHNENADFSFWVYCPAL